MLSTGTTRMVRRVARVLVLGKFAFHLKPRPWSMQPPGARLKPIGPQVQSLAQLGPISVHGVALLDCASA